MPVTKPEKINEKTVYQNKYSCVTAQKVDFGSFTKEFFVTDYGQKAGILIIRGDDVLLARQYRLLIDRLSYEIPGGRIDEGETPEEGAIRECHEETGIKCRDLKLLRSYHLTLENVNSFTYIFYTNKFAETDGFVPDSMEVEKIQWVPFKKCLEMIEEGTINDSFTIMAICAYKVFVMDKKDNI